MLREGISGTCVPLGQCLRPSWPQLHRLLGQTEGAWALAVFYHPCYSSYFLPPPSFLYLFFSFFFHALSLADLDLDLDGCMRILLMLCIILLVLA